MSQQPGLLDLSITLTPPPQGSPPEAIASIALSCSMLGLSHTGDLLTDPLTEQEREDLRWYLEAYWKWPFEGFLKRGKQAEALLAVVGKRLYETVFRSREAISIVQAWRLYPRVERQLSIVSNVPRALSLPWELLHDGQGFLVLRTRQPVTILRRLPQHELATSPTAFEPPLRVLLVTARPESEDERFKNFIDQRGIARELLEAVQEQGENGAAGTIQLEFLRPPTLPALRARLSDAKLPQVHVLHFDGHGIFGDAEDGPGDRQQGMLVFEDDNGKLDLVRAEVVAGVLQDSGVRLAVLTACQSAMGAADDAFSSVAAQLIQGGVDTVAAMSATILVASATMYAEAFYRELAEGTPAPTAQERARQFLHDNPRRHVLRRKLNEEGRPVELRDWWLPHFYQQRPLLLQSVKSSRKRRKQQVGAPLPRLSDNMPAEPRYSFSGRARELLQIERWLLRGRLVVIQGFGGVGKTALAREAADWLTRTDMFGGACFVSFEHGGDATMLLSILGNCLGVYDGNYDPHDSKAALVRLALVLKQKRILVIADNLESILPGGEAPLESAVRSQLWDVLLELQKAGARLLLTSRDTAFGDGRLAPGSRVAHLELKGLQPDDAYELASHVLDDLGIDRVRAPYAELRDLLAQLDYLPLAIQLVLPALREVALWKIRADFTELLPKFIDNTETGHNRSLLASLDYSLLRLRPDQQTLLHLLAPFEGGAMQADVLEITGIPEVEWARLRSALEQAALLMAEFVDEGIALPYLRFHPVLTPFLRGLPGADDAALNQHYIDHYCVLAEYLYDRDIRTPRPIRAWVRWELPNLRRALELALKAGNTDAATGLANRITHFLDFFGLWRERDVLRQRIAEAMTSAETQGTGVLTWAEYLQESGLADDELGKGEVHAAYDRSMALLARIEALPEGTPVGRNSYEHCATLLRIARCLIANGQAKVAEERLREGLAVIDGLLKPQLDNQDYMRLRGSLLINLGDVLRNQGQYIQAKSAYEEGLEIARQQKNLRSQGIIQSQLGSLSLRQQDYNDARSHYTEVVEIFHGLGEPATEAIAWHQLGVIAEDQQQWTEAERYHRESLMLREQQGDDAGTAASCNQLAIVAENTHRLSEAEGWYKRALELTEKVNPNSPEHAACLTNLAILMVREVRANAAIKEKLVEARGYAERALKMAETFDSITKIWLPLGTLADIAERKGQVEIARAYRRRERETFAAFADNRVDVDRIFGQLIVDAAATAEGDIQARGRVEPALAFFESDANLRPMGAAIRRIWSGERDWHALAEGVNRNLALVVLRVLETIARK